MGKSCALLLMQILLMIEEDDQKKIIHDNRWDSMLASICNNNKKHCFVITLLTL